MNISKIYQKAPYVYFALIALYFAYRAISAGKLFGMGGMVVLLLSVAFIYQLVREDKDLNILLGFLTVTWSLWMSLAVLSDAFKIEDFGSIRALRFMITGGLFIASNFLLSAKLFKNAVHRASVKEPTGETAL